MGSSFDAPGLDRLSQIDRSGAEYNTECVEIQGVVAENVQGAVQGNLGCWIHGYSFAAWRRIGGPLVERKLYIQQPVASMSEWSSLPALSVQRIKVILSKDETRAVVVERSEMSNEDAELNSLAVQLGESVVASTERFGEFVLDRRTNVFEAEVEWNEETITLRFYAYDETIRARAVETAESLWDDQAAWKRKIEDFAVSKLLALKNDAWLDQGESSLTAEQFKDRMSLQSISIRDDGAFDFWHDDGDLFFGHAIQISGSLEEGLTRADIPG